MTHPSPNQRRAKVRTAALAYASRGWRVLPVKGKFPPLLRSSTPGKGGVHMATTDPDQILKWWTRWPWANVAIAVGEATGLVAIDVDGPDGETALIELQGKHGDLPETLETSTGRAEGGRHLLFRYPAGRNMGNKVRFADGLDTRAENGYIIAPPSLHPETNTVYQWKKGHGPDDLEPAPLPGWLADMLEKPVPSGEPVKRGQARLPSGEAMSWGANLLRAAWPSEGRGWHQATLALVGGLLRAGWPLPAVEAFTRRVATRRRHPRPSEIPEAIRTTDEKLDQGALVTGWTELRKFVGEQTVNEALRLLGLREPRPEGAAARGGEPPPSQTETLHHRPELTADLTPEGNLYDLDDLDRDQGYELLSLARLPGWATGPGELEPPPSGHGWGVRLDGLLGGGLRPGEVLALVGPGSKEAKSSLALQLVDGLTLRSQQVVEGKGGWPPVLTPVLLMTDLSPTWLAWHGLARTTGSDIAIFREGRTGMGRSDAELDEGEVERAWILGRRLLAGLLGRARSSWMARLTSSAVLETAKTDPWRFAEHLAELIDQWRERIADKNPGRAVVPVVLLDPIERVLPLHVDRDRGLTLLARALRTAANRVDREFIALVTSSSTDRDITGLLQHVTMAFELRETFPPPSRDAPGEIELSLVKHQWGTASREPDELNPVSFAWYQRYARFIPLPERTPLG